ncbi:MAG: HAMP domain-containing protein [Deltaproteobacteria bacterium]|nr:HAMP domain-containing protein [Deltaproteobacteria bacterium]
MRLVTRLTLAFLAVVLIPAGAVLAFTWYTVEARFQDEFQTRLIGITDGLRADVERMGLRIQEKVRAMSESEAVERILVDMVRETLDRRSLIPAAEKWMKSRELDLLTVLDGSGVVLSSGHLKARYGSKDEASSKLAVDRPLQPLLRRVQLLHEGKIQDSLAVVVGASRRFNNARVLLVGGVVLDESFVGHLEKLSGARISIEDTDGRPIAGVRSAEDDWRSSPHMSFRRVALPSGDEGLSAYVVAGVSRSELDTAQRRILVASLSAAIAGVLVSFLLGLLLSRRLVRPISALVAGAREVAAGSMHVQVPKVSGAEMGILVETFNRMVADLEVYQKRLVRAERVAAWREIARRIAHEIKNPLSPIQVSIETMQKAYGSRHPDFAEIFEESTRAILEEVAALKRIVTEFSEFARMPKPSLARQPLDAVIENAVSLYRNQLPEGRLVCEIEPDLPEVLIDREQIGQVLSNLLSNALWAVEEGGRIFIRAGRQREPGASRGVFFQVQDEGRGMSDDVLEKAFTPYFTTRRDGTGLGLAIIQRIVEDHDGVIEVASREAQGTTVTVSLP